MIEKDAYDFLGDVPVDQPGSKSVAPLMERQMDRPAVFAPDVAPLQPAVELASVGMRGQGPGAVGIHPWRREHPPAAAGPTLKDALLLGGDVTLDLLIDGDQGFAFHLPVEVARVGGAVSVPDDAVEGQVAGVADPQPAAHKDQGQRPAVGSVPGAEVGRLFDLGHQLTPSGAP